MYYADKEKAIYMAKSVLNRHWNGRFPVDVHEIAHRMGVIVNNSPTGNLNLGDAFHEKLSGRFDIINNQAVCTINSSDSWVRRRFTLAHELGHYVLDHGSGFRDTAYSFEVTPDYRETEANYFAAELLMPTEYIQNYLQQNNVNIDNNWSIREMANFFDVSERAIYVRLEYLGIL